MKIRLPKELPELADKAGNRNVSVIQIIHDDKILITKTVNIPWLATELQSVMGKYQRNGVPETNFYYPLIKRVYKSEYPTVKIEVLFTTTNGYEALKYELELLTEWYGKPECLNKNNIPHIPKTIYAKKGSNWLTQNQMLNFKKLLTKYQY